MSEQEDKGSRRLSLKRGDAAGQAQPRLEERLHKVLAQAGLGSRRALEQRIADGVVKVNGEVATVGMSVGGGDRIEIDIPSRTIHLAISDEVMSERRAATQCRRTGAPVSA